MFSFLFRQNKGITYNSKKVKKWQTEHQKLGEYATAIIAAYEARQMKKAHKLLSKLKDLALEHLMDEDETFFKLMRNAKEEDEQVVTHIKEFRNSFRDVKIVLFDFLVKYTSPNAKLDRVFKDTLDQILQALVARIEFEEKNLYALINK